MRPDDASRPLTNDVDFRFYVGIHHPRMAWPLTLHGFRLCLSANVLRDRGDTPFLGCDEPWLLDSGAFTRSPCGAGSNSRPMDTRR